MASNRIYVQVDFGTGQAQTAINGLNQSVRNIGSSAQSASTQATGALGRISVQVEQMNRQFDRAKAALIGLAGSGVGAGILKVTSDFQRARIALTQMLGSADAAKKVLADLVQLSLQQPFQFSELQNLTTMLSAFGFRGKELLGTVRAVADSASALGGTAEKLNQIGLALGQIKVKQKLNAEEINKQLGEAGVPASRYLAEELSRQTGKPVSVGDTLKLAENQRLNAEVGLQAIIRGMQRDFGGLGASVTNNVIGAQFEKLADAAKFAAVELGEAFTPAATKTVSALRGMIQFLEPAIKGFRELPEFVRNSTAALIALTAVLAILPTVLQFLSFIPGNIAKAAVAFTTLRTVVTAVATGMTGALVGSEAMLLRFGKAVLIVGAAFAGWKMGEWLRENVGPLKEFSNWLQDSVWSKMGLVSNADIRKGAEADENLRFAIGKRAESMRRRGLAVPDRGTGTDEEYAAQLRENEKSQLDQERRIKEELLKANEVAIKAAVDGARAKLEQTRRQLATGLFKIEPEYAEAFKSARDAGAGEAVRLLRQSVAIEVEREKVSLFGGRVVGRDGNRDTFIWGQMQRDLAGQLDAQRDSGLLDMARSGERFGSRLALGGEAFEVANQADMDRLRSEEDSIKRLRDLRMQDLDAIQAVTVEQKIAVEEQRYRIETETSQKLFEHRKMMLKLEFDAEMLMLEVRLRGAMATEEQILQIREAYQKRYQGMVGAMERENADERTAREKALNNTRTNIVIDQQRRSYDQLKNGAERVFDALLNRSQSVFGAIGNAFKVAMLTAIREVVTSRIAASLMQLFGLGTVTFQGGGQLGGTPSFGGARGGGALGSLAGLLGLGGGAGILGGGGGGVSFPGAPGGTPGFAGPVGSVSGNAAPGGAGGGGLFGGAAGLAGFGSLLFNSGSIALGGGAATTAAGIGGLKGTLAGLGSSGAALAAGPLLMLAGYRAQNKALKFGLSIGGGLLSGFALGAKIGSIGGPLGAGIGAAVGGGIALLSMLRKSPEQKAREAIKSAYGVDIWDKGILAQVAQTAQGAFGGNFALAVQSPQIRELIQLWSQMTGQKAVGMPAQAQPLSVAQSGGSLYQQPNSSNGMPMPLVGGGMISGGVASNAPTSLVIRLDGAATTDLLRGEAVQAVVDNPRASQSAVLNSTRSNAGRREFLSLQLAPGTLTS
jgi:tape measure domain-containing protein